MLAALAKSVRNAIGKEVGNIRNYNIPLRQRARMYRHYFLSDRDIVYDLSNYELSDYLSDLAHAKTVSIGQPYNVMFNDKLIYHLMLSNSYPEHIPSLVAVVAPDGSIKKTPASNIDDIDGLLEYTSESDVVIKPRVGSGGKGVHFLKNDRGELMFDSESIDEKELSTVLSSLDESIIVEYIDQENYASEIHPNSVNTIRVLTMVDPDNGEVFVPAAFHRFGSSKSGKVDNISSGGVTVDIDLDSGVLGAGYTSPKKSPPKKHSSHPDTGKQFEGTEIPHWDSVIGQLTGIVEEHSGLWPYVGWDIIITDDQGDFVLLEGNPATGIDTFQIHKPLLKDDRVRRFYEHYGII